MNKAFTNFTWKNTPSIDSPINALNLNSINNGLDTVDDRVIAMDTSKADKDDLLTDLVAVDYNGTTGVWTFTKRNNTTVTFDQNIEKIPVSFSMSAQGVITMTTADGTQYTANVADLIKLYTFVDSSVIDFTTTEDASGNKEVTATIKTGAITDSMLQPSYLADITVQARNASNSADAALLSATSAGADALLAQSYAVGTGGARTGEATDNAKYYKEQAASSAGDSEAYAVGTRGGTAVPSTDPAYQNNAKYYAEHGTLAGLQDTNLGTLTDGDALVYDGTSQKWVNGAGGSSSGPKIFYGTCDTAAATAEKAVACSDFTAADLTAGNVIAIKFTNDNTAGFSVGITLNVNSTGAKSVVRYGTNVADIYSASWMAGQTMLFVYDGTYWHIILPRNNDINNNGLTRKIEFKSYGTASTTGVNYQEINPGTGAYNEIRRSKYMQGTVTTSTSGTSSITFSNSEITASSVIEVFTSVWDVYPSAVSTSTGSCTLTFPKQSSAQSVTVRIYIS